SFGDDFVFPEEQSMTSVARQVGNAVPPLLARRIAEALAAHLDAQAEDDAPTDAVEARAVEARAVEPAAA
ncbi:MAG TPA: DNA cytosine methyltransferase, partial [Solirubrobacterales bacterium]|nr:DNA cytosine methyltransferase [Solirubrobacterales bacterium]